MTQSVVPEGPGPTPSLLRRERLAPRPHRRSPVGGARDACGVFAVHAPGEDAAKLCYFGLYALQHRGQESAGIAIWDGANILVSKEMGLVSQVFDEERLASMPGEVGIGHVRYSTTGTSTWEASQPTFSTTAAGTGLALAHNGNLVNTGDLVRGLGRAADGCATDSELLTAMVAAQPDVPTEEALARTLPQVRGAYSLVLMDEGAIYGARDPHGVRPLVMGRLPGGGWVLASETAALDIVGAVTMGEVAPGEIVAIDHSGLRTRRFAPATPKACLFEYVYVARPDHHTGETTISAARRRMGALLAAQAPAAADLVIGVPDSGTVAASGFSEASGIPYADGLVKNRYVGRTFIQPTQSLRELGIRLKLNPLRDVIGGQRLVVVDDTIVRGNTSRQLVAMLRDAGAAQIHLRITAPPVRHPCFYGIDMATHSELIGAGLSIEEIRDFVGADSLAYLELESLVRTTRRPAGSLCKACFDGEYPIPVPAELQAAGKGVMAAARAGQ